MKDVILIMSRISCRNGLPHVLKKLMDLHQAVNMKTEIIARLREISFSIGRSDYRISQTGGKHSRRNNRSKIEENTVKILTIEENLKNDINELSELTEKFLSVLDSVDTRLTNL